MGHRDFARTARISCSLAFVTLIAFVARDVRGEPPATDSETSQPGAQDPNAAAAEKIFAEGRDLLARGENAAACERFEESRKLAPGAVGPLLNLALCNEALGKLATAARHFREVVDRSLGVREDRVDSSVQHLRALEPRLSRVRVMVPAGARVPGLVVKLDGAVLGEDQWGAEIPIDGGEHVVEASTSIQNSLRVPFNVANERGQVVVALDALDEGAKKRKMGYAIGGMSTAVLVAGIGLGISLAVRCGGLFQDTCSAAEGKPNPERERTLDSLSAQGWLANALVGASLIGLGTGAYLVFSSQKPSGKIGLQLSSIRGGGGALLHGAF